MMFRVIRMVVVASLCSLPLVANQAWSHEVDQERDLSFIMQAVQDALESNRSGETTGWRNNETGHHGEVTPIRTYQSHTNQWCRDFERTWDFGPSIKTYVGTACRLGDGFWETFGEHEISHVARPAPSPQLFRQLITDVQVLLISLSRLDPLRFGSVNPGLVDGVLGQRTIEAIKAFQRRVGLVAEGHPSKELKERLQAEAVSLETGQRRLLPFPNEQELRDRDDALKSREAKLERREIELRQQGKRVSSQESQLAAKGRELSRFEDQLREQERRLALLRKEIPGDQSDMEHRFLQREKELQAREEAVVRKEQELVQQQRELSRRRNKLERLADAQSVQAHPRHQEVWLVASLTFALVVIVGLAGVVYARRGTTITPIAGSAAAGHTPQSHHDASPSRTGKIAESAPPEGRFEDAYGRLYVFPVPREVWNGDDVQIAVEQARDAARRIIKQVNVKGERARLAVSIATIERTARIACPNPKVLDGSDAGRALGNLPMIGDIRLPFKLPHDVNPGWGGILRRFSSGFGVAEDSFFLTPVPFGWHSTSQPALPESTEIREPRQVPPSSVRVNSSGTTLPSHASGSDPRTRTNTLAQRIDAARLDGRPVSIATARHEDITLALRDVLHLSDGVPPFDLTFVYEDGSHSGLVHLRSLAERESSQTGSHLDVALMSCRHFVLDLEVDCCLIRNAEIDRRESSTFREQEDLAYERMQALVKEHMNGDGLRIRLYHTGLEPAVIGTYRLVIDVLLEGEKLAVVPVFVRGNREYAPQTPWGGNEVLKTRTEHA